MSRENVETVREIYAEWACGNYRGAPQPYAQDIVWTTFAGEGDGLVFRGRDEVRRWFREFFSQWSDFRIQAREIVDHGDKVLVVGHQTGEGKASGVSISMPVYAVWTFRGGRVVELLQTRHLDEALEHLGSRA